MAMTNILATTTSGRSAARFGLVAALGVAAAVAAPLSAKAQPSPEYTTYHPLYYRLAHQAAEGCQGMGLINLPSGWSQGDAAVVLVSPSTLNDASRDSLVAGLLQEGAAVVEIATDGPQHCLDGPRRAATPRDPRAELAAVRQELRQFGAGLTVTIGYGPDGETVLRAVTDGVAPGQGYAAAVAIADGTVRFARGAGPDQAEGWPLRAGRFCAALAAAAQGGSDATHCTRVLRAGVEAPAPILATQRTP